MFEMSYKELGRCGYLYDSSKNPAFIPGRYNNTDIPRKPFLTEGILEIPTSVTGLVRMPLFWLALHLLPLKFYYLKARSVLKKTGYFATYFHPWEFAEIGEYKNVPIYIKRNSGKLLVERLRKVIDELKKTDVEFMTYVDFAKTFLKENE